MSVLLSSLDVGIGNEYIIGANTFSRAQILVVTQPFVPESVSVYIRRNLSPTGTFDLALMDISGTPGVNAVPGGTVYAVTNGVNPLAFPTSFGLFNFNFSTQPSLPAGNYAIVARGGSVSGLGGNLLFIGAAGYDAYGPGNQADATPGWSANSLEDLNFYLYGSQVTTDRTVTGLSNVRAAVDRTITGKTSIAATTSRTQVGVSNVRATTTRTITGQAFIGTPYDQPQTGKASILKAITQTISGKGAVLRTVDKTQTGQSYVVIPTDRTTTGRSFIVTRYERYVPAIKGVIQ